MLVLSRKAQETLVIDDQIRIVVLDSSARGVRLGIEAPPHISVHRGEIHQRIVAERCDRPTEQDAA